MSVDTMFCCLVFALGLLATLFDAAVLLTGLTLGWIDGSNNWRKKDGK